MLYPPSDIMSVTVTAGEGCGAEHRRPAGPDGYPVHPWAISCAGGCEEWLRLNDSRFAGAVHEIPETYDEKRQREQRDHERPADQDSHRPDP